MSTEAPKEYDPLGVWLSLIFAAGVIAFCVFVTMEEAPRRDAYRRLEESKAALDAAAARCEQVNCRGN